MYVKNPIKLIMNTLFYAAVQSKILPIFAIEIYLSYEIINKDLIFLSCNVESLS